MYAKGVIHGMYVKRALIKKYLEKITDKILSNIELQRHIEQEKHLNLERKLFGEEICLSIEFFEDDSYCYISLAAWQMSHWTSFLFSMSPVGCLIPVRKK